MNLPEQGKTRFERHGRVRMAEGGRHLTHEDGTPFFYLADTAWSGALLASDEHWRKYLADRAQKGFTAIQFILAAPWAAAPADEEQRIAYAGDDPLGRMKFEANEPFFERMDRRVSAINEAGLLAAPVLAWAANFGESGKLNPGTALPTKFLTELIRFEVARYGKHHVMWVLAGDGKYGGLRSWKWKRIGRAVFGDRPHAPVALHAMGGQWPYRSFRREAWLDVCGYQSGHSDAEKNLQWLLSGPPARAWRETHRAIVNMEPCYEGIRNWAADGPFTAKEVRRAMYASLLNAPTAGVTYGAHGVWSWEPQAREPLNHAGSGLARPWWEAMAFQGSFDVQRLAALIHSIEWWRLRPAQDLVGPQVKDGARFISCAATESRDLVVCYLPCGGVVPFHLPAEAAGWFDPRTGERHAASARSPFEAPTPEDWILLIRASH